MAGSGGFSVTVSATDKATETLKKINASIAALTKPVTQAQTAFAKLTKDSGLDKLTKSLNSTGNAAVSAFEKLGVLGGAGAVGGIGTLGGIALVTRQWAEMGNQISLTSLKIGIGADQIGRFQTAARLAGVSADVASQGAAAMAKNIGDVLSGRNPQMAGYFAQLGIRARYDANGQADVAGAFRDLSDVLKRSPTAQGKNAILAALGLPEDMRGYIENVDQLSDAAAKMRPNFAAATEAGRQLDRSMSALRENISGIGDNIEVKLAPGLKKIIDGFDWIAEKGNKLTQSGAMQHVAVIAGGAGSGTLAGALTGAGTGAVLGIPGGPWGMLAGAGWGAFRGGLMGGAGGAIIAGGADLLGSISGSVRNNPGNLRASPTSFRSYATPAEGLAAAAQNLIGYQTRYGINTLSGIANRWAPPSENDTAGYIRGLSESTGYLPNEQIDLRNPGTASAVLGGILRQEGNKASPDAIAQAVATALARMNMEGGKGGQVTVVVNAPAGTTATAHSNSDYWPARIQYGMPTGAVTP